MAIFSKSSDLPAPLTAAERDELGKLEAAVTTGIKAFSIAGKALARIRDKQLFRESHNSFEQYVAERWSMTRQHAARLIEASAVVGNLSPTGDGLVPSSERQVRPLTALTPADQQAAWSEVVATAPRDAQGKPQVTTVAIEAAARKRDPNKKRRKARPKPTRIKVPGAIVLITPNGKFSGTAMDALQAAIAKLASTTATRAAA
jgi:hypothetical protein